MLSEILSIKRWQQVNEDKCDIEAKRREIGGKEKSVTGGLGARYLDSVAWVNSYKDNATCSILYKQ